MLTTAKLKNFPLLFEHASYIFIRVIIRNLLARALPTVYCTLYYYRRVRHSSPLHSVLECSWRYINTSAPCARYCLIKNSLDVFIRGCLYGQSTRHVDVRVQLKRIANVIIIVTVTAVDFPSGTLVTYV